MIKNKDFLGCLCTNPYYFHYFDLNNFTLFYNGKPIHSESLTKNIVHEKITVPTYNTLFEGSGIRSTNAVLQLNHDKSIAGYLMLCSN